MRYSLRCFLAFSVLTAAGASAQTRDLRTSWGKPGISFDQYRADAVECGITGHYVDVSGTDAAKAFVNGSRRINTLLDNNADVETAMLSARIVEAVRPAERRKEIKNTLVSTVEQCLASRGYQRFRLSDEQRDKLRKMPKGSDQRHAYLYRLARSKKVLSTQAF